MSARPSGAGDGDNGQYDHDRPTDRARSDRTASTRAGGVGARAAKHNEGGFRMAWGKLRRLALVSSASHSHRGRPQGLLNESGVILGLEGNLPGCAPSPLLVRMHPNIRRILPWSPSTP